MKEKFSTASLFLTTLAFPIGVFSGVVARLYLKQSNPDTIDITIKTAYLNQSALVGLTVFGAVVISAIVCLILAARRDNNVKLAQKLLVLISITVALGGLSYIAYRRTVTIEKNYTQKRVKDFWQRSFIK